MKSKNSKKVVQVFTIVLLFIVLFTIAFGYKSTKVSYSGDSITIHCNSSKGSDKLKNLFTGETLYIVYGNVDSGLPDESSYSEVTSGGKYLFGTTRFEKVEDTAKILTIAEYSDGVFSKPVYLTYSVSESLGTLTVEIKSLDNNVYDLISKQDFIKGLLSSYNIEY